jgi:hypothetical protein
VIDVNVHFREGDPNVEAQMIDDGKPDTFPVLRIRDNQGGVAVLFFRDKAQLFRFSNAVARAIATMDEPSEDDPDPQERGEQIRDESVDAALCDTPPIVQAIRSVEEIFDHARAGFEEVALEEEKVE